ncbi:hypothetical protein DFH07DRAFT_74162 [Mycena maculata]|uniref:Uncharacterized protein n=1 Tax=Mycena maculata TaxID=230809 RepID=A0AAD7NU11_9AGAR|nr:hypothetical protein DFH07DRAFT_74162 [Mycena maculata]
MTDSRYGHVLSPKSEDLDRNTFFFVSLRMKARLYLGVNQKFTPVSSAIIHHWVKLMRSGRELEEPEEFFLCPVTVKSRGVMSYYVRRSGPVIEPDSKERLPPGNYGWYFDRECTLKGFPDLSRVAERFCTFQARLAGNIECYGPESIADPFPFSAVARDERRCRFTGSTDDTVLAWIVPPGASWETDDHSDPRKWDETPFLVDGNVLAMQKALVSHFHGNHFTVDVDDDYRILVLRGMGAEQRLLPPRLPHQDEATEHFLRLHCRHSLSLMLRGGDIEEVYPTRVIMRMMEELGVNYYGDEGEKYEMAPLDDERWQTVMKPAWMTLGRIPRPRMIPRSLRHRDLNPRISPLQKNIMSQRPTLHNFFQTPPALMAQIFGHNLRRSDLGRSSSPSYTSPRRRTHLGIGPIQRSQTGDPSSRTTDGNEYRLHDSRIAPSFANVRLCVAKS